MIPKTLHYFWIGKNPMGDKEKRCISSWKKYLPGFEIKLWNENNFDFSKNEYMVEAIKNKKYGFAIDVARLYVLYEYGGVYLDTDVEFIKKFDDKILDNKMFCCFEGKRGINFGSIVGAEKANETIKYLLDQYKYRKFILKDGSLNLATCVKYQTQDLRKRLGIKLDNKMQSKDGVSIFPSDYFDPKDPSTGAIGLTTNTYSIHHFAGTWLSDSDHKRLEKKRAIMSKHRILGKVYADMYLFFSILKEKGIKSVFMKIKNRI